MDTSNAESPSHLHNRTGHGTVSKKRVRNSSTMFGSVGHTGITFGLVSRLREAATAGLAALLRRTRLDCQAHTWTRWCWSGGLSFGLFQNRLYQLKKIEPRVLLPPSGIPFLGIVAKALNTASVGLLSRVTGKFNSIALFANSSIPSR